MDDKKNIYDPEYRKKVRKWAMSSSTIVPPQDIIDLLDALEESLEVIRTVAIVVAQR